MPSSFSVGEARGNSFFNCLLSSSTYLRNRNQVTMLRSKTASQGSASILEIKEPITEIMKTDTGWALATPSKLQDRPILPAQDCIMSHHASKMVISMQYTNTSNQIMGKSCLKEKV